MPIFRKKFRCEVNSRFFRRKNFEVNRSEFKKREARLKNFEVNLRSEFRRKLRSKNTSKWVLESKRWFMGHSVTENVSFHDFLARCTTFNALHKVITQEFLYFRLYLAQCFITMALGLWQYVRRFHFPLLLLSPLFYRHKLRSTTDSNNSHALPLFKHLSH